MEVFCVLFPLLFFKNIFNFLQKIPDLDKLFFGFLTFWGVFFLTHANCFFSKLVPEMPKFFTSYFIPIS
jgi:hypothetical protein